MISRRKEVEAGDVGPHLQVGAERGKPKVE
jgi:hypothetical protein